ncbi:MAG: type I methionyl aminopeptidase [Breznakia sp.]
MITCKSEREIEFMREAGRIVALAHQAAKAAIRPGVSTKTLNQICEDVILANDATPSFKGLYGFPSTCCMSLNNVLVHGFPSSKVVLKEGDILAIDIGACYKGYHGDSAWTYPVGEISDENARLLKATEESLYEGLKQAKAHNRLSDISHAIETHVHSYGFSVPRDYTGHGIGSEVHEDPSVPNFGKPGFGVKLKSGMCLAIEPMVQAGRPQTKVLDDNWSVVSADGSMSAHYEHTIVVREDGCEILTTLHNDVEDK